MSEAVKKILFAQTSSDQFIPATETDTPPYSALYQLLKDEGYHLDFTSENITHERLTGIDVLVIGVPEYVHNTVDIEAIEEFVSNGGALLLVTNAATMLNPPTSLNEMAAIAGLKFQEYLNCPPTYLQVFRPHSITGNINRIRIGSIASIVLLDETDAHPLALTKAMRQPIMAYSNMGKGRVVAMGDVDWLETVHFNRKDNRNLAVNLFQWLTITNSIEIIALAIPPTIEWSQSATISLRLKSNSQDHTKITCLLESDSNLLIFGSAQVDCSILPHNSTTVQWKVQPQTLGKQKLRLSLYTKNDDDIYFDHLPKMQCVASGYFTLRIKDYNDVLKTTYETGEQIFVDGVFHWETTPFLATTLSLTLEPIVKTSLESMFSTNISGDGLVITSYESNADATRWSLQAIKPGEYQITIGFENGNQEFSTLIKVGESYDYQLNEIYAAYVYPLDAEIAERLRQVYPILSDNNVRSQPFQILPTDKFIQALYAGENAARISAMLASARREQWPNFNLLNIILDYFTPSYLPNRGSFIPYDPNLASHLAQLHINERRFLEYSLLRSNESSGIQLKQDIAAYLLHQKYGHGFFYSHTQLGQQITILERHPVDQNLRELVKDSAIIVNEGFATWIEFTFLEKLDREIQPSVASRQKLLLEEDSGLFFRELHSEFFRQFPSQFDSRYREGFEYLDYIGRTLTLRCAIHVFLIATNVDLGIRESDRGNLEFFDKEAIYNLLLDPENPVGRSHFRLRAIAELLLANELEVKELIRTNNCPHDCRQTNCPLESFIVDQLEMNSDQPQKQLKPIKIKSRDERNNDLITRLNRLDSSLNDEGIKEHYLESFIADQLGMNTSQSQEQLKPIKIKSKGDEGDSHIIWLNRLDSSFNEEGIRELYLDLDVDYGKLFDQEKHEKIRELILHLTDTDRMSDLDASYKRLRPDRHQNKLRNRRILKNQLDQSFSEEEIKGLCFDLGVDYDNLPSQGKLGKIQELILYFIRRKDVSTLVDRCKELRPNERWIQDVS